MWSESLVNQKACYSSFLWRTTVKVVRPAFSIFIFLAQEHLMLNFSMEHWENKRRSVQTWMAVGIIFYMHKLTGLISYLTNNIVHFK